LCHQFKNIQKKIMAKTKWILDPTHSELGFKIKHLMITSISGSVKSFEADVEMDETDFSLAQITLTAEMASISTNNEQRDAHLRTSDFFEVEKYPELKFRSTKLEKIDSDTFNLYGELTLKGVTKPVELNVEFNGVTKDPWGSERAGLVVNGKISRSEWGVNFNSVLEKGQPFATVEDTRSVTAEIQVPESDIGYVVIGAPIRAKPAAFFDREFVGKVQTMDRNVTAKSFGNVVKVIAVIDNPKGELKTGMTGYAKIGGTMMPVWKAFSLALLRFFNIQVWSWIP